MGVLSQADDLLRKLGMKGSLFGSQAAEVLPPTGMDGMGGGVAAAMERPDGPQQT